MMRRCLACVVVVVLALVVGAAAEGREVIERFDVRILVQPDGAIEVTETIRITVEGVEVRRGIEREIPLLRADGRRASFELLEVRRGDAAEAIAQIRRREGVLIRIGSADRLLPVPSVQTYTIRYRSHGQLRGFRGFDELYWNVTGHNTPFAIAAASVVVVLPDGVELVQDAAYTGTPDARGTAFRVSEREAGRYAAETTAALPPGHGFTVAASWTKGSVAGVVEGAERPLILGLPALLATLPAAVGASVLMALGLRLGFCGGPREGVVYPRFRPPDDLSPAACRYLVTRRVDDRSLAACIVGLATKGALRIVDRSGRWRFTLEPVGTGAGLHPDEAAVHDNLFEAGDETGSEPVALGGLEDRVAAARRALERVILRAHWRTDFRNTDTVFGLGLMAILAVVCGAIVVPYHMMPALAAGCLGSLAGAAAVTAFVVWWFRRDARPVATRVSRGMLGDNLEIVCLLLVPAIAAGVVGLHLAIGLDRHGAVVELAVAGIFGVPLGGLVVVFAHSLVVPTPLGCQRLDAIDGLALYLSVAEADRLEALHPPERTAEHFEALLPYAIALGHVRSWTRRFAQALGTTRPEWYERAGSGRDDSWDWLEEDRFERDVRETRQKPSEQPSRGGRDDDDSWGSPGSGGGGSSGGGGGGGGTRGW